MAVNTFYTLSEYIRSRSTLKLKIEAIENLITEMELKMLESIDSTGKASYLFDDGQVRVQTEFRSMKEITDGVQALEKLLQKYINQYNGRVYVLRGRANY